MRESKRILLVEDDADIRSVTCATLRTAGYEVAEAENGKRGLGLVASSRPDLIILDVMMPEMNGVEFCRALAEELRMPDLPVLILSSINEKSGLMRSLADVELTRREFLKKPVGPVELKLRVAQMLGLEARPGAAKPAQGAGSALGADSPPRAALAPRRAAGSDAAMEPAAPTGSRLRLLIVDDDRDLLQINKFSLQKDFDIAIAENGLDGLEMLDLFEPDFVLVDYNMPTMDGLEMVELMRRHPHFHQTPALFLTGNDEKQLPRRAHESGINLFLRKPIEPPRLRHALGQFVKAAGLQPRVARRSEPRPGHVPEVRIPSPPPQAGPAKMARPLAPEPIPPAEGSKARMRPRSEGGATARPVESPRPAATPGAAPGTAPGPQRVRLLIVDDNATTSGKVLQIVKSAFGHLVHYHHAPEHRDALANLARWEPDIILYNPRNAGLDGIAFFQLFKIKRLDLDVEFAFAGREFTGAEQKYSRQSFGREVIDLGETESRVVYELQSMIEKAERKDRPKRHSIEELRDEDAREKQQQAKAAEREARQREFDRQRFGRIQSMLDREA